MVEINNLVVSKCEACGKMAYMVNGTCLSCNNSILKNNWDEAQYGIFSSAIYHTDIHFLNKISHLSFTEHASIQFPIEDIFYVMMLACNRRKIPLNMEDGKWKFAFKTPINNRWFLFEEGAGGSVVCYVARYNIPELQDCVEEITREEYEAWLDQLLMYLIKDARDSFGKKLGETMTVLSKLDTATQERLIKIKDRIGQLQDPLGLWRGTINPSITSAIKPISLSYPHISPV